jgi:hypothetical protein
VRTIRNTQIQCLGRMQKTSLGPDSAGPYGRNTLDFYSGGDLFEIRPDSGYPVRDF